MKDSPRPRAEGERPAPVRVTVSRTAAAAVSAAALAALLFWVNSPPAASRGGPYFAAEGASAQRVAVDLKSAGFLRSERFFVLAARITGRAKRLRAGFYRVRAGQGALGIIADMAAGRTCGTKVTLPEGFASWQMAQRLDEAQVCGAEGFRAEVASRSAEGYLFPDTYYFEPKTPPARVVNALRRHFEEMWSAVFDEARAQGQVTEVSSATFRLGNGRVVNRHQVVTLASLVEREARRDEERPLIAAVYWNRLNKRMYLESDPTVQFALGQWKERVVFADLEVKSPYNTYRHFGLPPGPICSPGRRSLQAALVPAPVNYLYFVADLSGGHEFSNTFEEHKPKVRRWNNERKRGRIEKTRRERLNRKGN